MKKKAILAALVIGFTMSLQPPAFTNSHLFNSPDKSGDTLTEVDNYSCYIKVFLEGPFNGTGMNTNLFDNGQLPVNQPYNVPPWNYNGTETLMVSPGADVVDWVYLEFRRTPYGPESATPETTVYRRAGLLLSDGTITEVDGSSRIWIYAPPLTNMYVVVYHRNHLALLSNTPLIPWAPAGVGYDFSDDLSKAYLDGQKELTPGIFGMIGGDCDANGIIELNDKEVCWTPEAGHTGYLPGDWNLDLQINNPDKDDIWFVNMGLESKVPRAFECGEILTDFRDDQTYPSVLIGEQCWISKNMNLGTYIPLTTPQADNDIIEKYCYNNDTANCTTYGGLYQWNEMMQYSIDSSSNGICPMGWHIPTDHEVKVLEGTVDSQFGVGDPIWDSLAFRGFDAGKRLKSTYGWIPSGNGTDDYGFTILPGGFSVNNFFGYLGTNAFIATSTEISTDNSWYRYFERGYDNIYRSGGNKGYGLSVRCMRNNQPPNIPKYLTPDNSSTNQRIDMAMEWICSDEEDDPLSFDLYFGTSTNPPLDSAGITSFSFIKEGLDCNTTYYWKIIAHDDHQNQTEGPAWSFTTTWKCGCTVIDERDSKLYNTVQIGEQCWMAENLNIGTRVDGILDQTDNSIIEKYCYNDEEDSCYTYGGLYQWDEMMQYMSVPSSQGVCPDEWHIPAMSEWTSLVEYLGGTGVAGGKMKEAGTIHWNSPNTGATNESGFTAFPAGYRNEMGTFHQVRKYAEFWPSNDSSYYSWKTQLH